MLGESGDEQLWQLCDMLTGGDWVYVVMGAAIWVLPFPVF